MVSVSSVTSSDPCDPWYRHLRCSGLSAPSEVSPPQDTWETAQLVFYTLLQKVPWCCCSIALSLVWDPLSSSLIYLWKDVKDRAAPAGPEFEDPEVHDKVKGHQSKVRTAVQRGNNLLLCLLAPPFRGHHTSSVTPTPCSPPSLHPWTSTELLLSSSCLHPVSSVDVQTTSASVFEQSLWWTRPAHGKLISEHFQQIHWSVIFHHL